MSTTNSSAVHLADIVADSAYPLAKSLVFIVAVIQIARSLCPRRPPMNNSSVSPLDSPFLTLTMDKFLKNIERETPIRFTSQQLRSATKNFSTLLGAGSFGAVYRGIFSNETVVAVKVLSGSSDKRIEEQFMAEVSTIGRIHHFNLVRLYGFCFERHLKALVFEYMANGSLDRFLFNEQKKLGFEELHLIAIGIARGIAYLHEECQQRIIHCDIKPGNILLDANFFPKVADFGLAKLYDRDKTHITMTCGRGTRGYVAPELWMPYPITHKCDVYSFGMLLFDIIGSRRNLDINLPKSEEWFPSWIGKKIEKGHVREVMIVCRIEERDREVAERMVRAALWCVQHKPESRPLMSYVVKMLEGVVEVPTPPKPSLYLLKVMPTLNNSEPTPRPLTTNNSNSFDTESSSLRCATPIMRKYGIEMASIS